MIRFIQFINENDEYVYHATSHENLQDIKHDGKLKTHKPWHGTDQSSWPDGSTEKRSYWGHNEKHVAPFHPEHGKPVVIRAKREHVQPKDERGTGDLYTTKHVHAKHLEYHHEGAWHKLTD